MYGIISNERWMLHDGEPLEFDAVEDAVEFASRVNTPFKIVNLETDEVVYE